MPKQYIEIDSTYRDRKRFKNPCNFVVSTTDTGITSDWIRNTVLNERSTLSPTENHRFSHPKLRYEHVKSFRDRVFGF